MTIYVQDDLADAVKQADDINVSGVCQDALRAELQRRATLAGMDKGVKRVVVFVDEPFNSDVAFYGKEIYYNSGAPETTVYLTKNHRIAIYDNDAQALHQFDSFAELAAVDFWDYGTHAALVATVADALGEKRVLELDI